MNILHIVPGICYGGIEQVILRYTQLTNLSHHVLTLSSEKSSQVDIFKERFSSVTLNENSNAIAKYIFIYNFIRNKKFDVIHLHLNEMSGVVFTLIKLIDRKVKIVLHSHNFYRKNQETAYIGINKNITKFVSQKSNCLKFACTHEAGNWLFGSNYKLIRNAFYLSDFSPDSEKFRNRVSFIARLEKQKQPLLALDIFNKYFKKHYQMQFVGNGSLKDIVKEKIQFESDVTISEPSNNVNVLLSKTDVLLAPSAYEGLGIIVLEAYCSGCIIIISRGYPKDVTNLPGVIVLDTENNIGDDDITMIKAMRGESRILRSQKNQQYLRSIGYDLKGESFDHYY
ncbi:glycosyltransferase [Vibrio sp. 1CM8B]|uniref:glycosyltransferase n=1 Tax=Vibrio sp. 1CM8B TaxID=2929167 RepID=UPI0020C06CBA|nr:glycosyltransferase [Vibrio sp. 1CM8B]MCK8087077.1 glycosyltransferase [Vibrio sp. 1CM8B]